MGNRPGRPGNVHELPHVVERAVALATGPMLEAPGVWLSWLDAAIPPRGPGMPPGRSDALGGAVQHLLAARPRAPSRAQHQGAFLTATTLW